MRPASRSRQGCGFRDFHGLKVSLGGELLCSEPGGDPPPWARICGIWFRILCDVTQPSKDPSPSLGWRLSESPLGKGSPSALRVPGLQDEAGWFWAGVQEGAGCGVWALMIPRSTGGPSPGRARIHTTHSVSQPSVQVTKPHDGGEWRIMENHEVHFIFFFFAFYPKVSPSVSSDINPINFTIYEKKDTSQFWVAHSCLRPPPLLSSWTLLMFKKKANVFKTNHFLHFTGWSSLFLSI